MTIKKKLKNLYCKFDIPIKCGVVDEYTYLRQKIKIVFLLKEPNSKQKGWSIPENLAKQIKWLENNKGFENKKFKPTWVPAGMWAYAILNGFKPYLQLKYDSLIAQGLSCIGMTNLKKTGGKGRANPREISEAAHLTLQLWSRELKIMRPDLVICGGTYNDVIRNLGLDNNKLSYVRGSKNHYALWGNRGHTMVLLDFWHPACRKKRTEILNSLERIVKELTRQGILLPR